MSFSERMGIEGGSRAVQVDSMDENLRTALYNLLLDEFLDNWLRESLHSNAGPGLLAARIVFTDFLRHPADEFSIPKPFFQAILKDVMFKGQWNRVYDLIEFVDSSTPLSLDPGQLNRVLLRDSSGYRWRESRFIPISDATELAAIDDALALPDPFAGARSHIVDALMKLSQKPEPDTRNAITEAVSAVESAARVVTGKLKATLPDALKALESESEIHPALKDAWLKLYGYTSDEEGLRHAMTEDPKIDLPTAKYMVVSSAAFVNLLSARRP